MEQLKAGQADIGVYFNSFFPSFLNAGDHPIQVVLHLYNDGPDSVGGSVPVRVEIFFSRNSTFGDGDDFLIGSTSVSDVIPSNGSADITLYNPNGLSYFTVPSSACGNYYAFMRVSSAYSDPFSFDNVNDLPGTISVSSTGPAPTVQSIVRRVPTSSVVNTSTVIWRVTFSQPVHGVDTADFTVARLNGSISGTSVKSVQQPSATVADVSVGTGTGSGDLRLDVSSSVATIYNACEQPLALSYSGGEVYTVLRTGPAVLSVGPVSPDPTHSAVASVNVVFSAPVNLSTFTYQDVALTRNGSPVALGSGVTASFVSGNTYRLTGLDSSTAPAGVYLLTVTGSGITDSSGNPGTGSASDRWFNIQPGDQAIYVNHGYGGADANGSFSSPFRTVSDANRLDQE